MHPRLGGWRLVIDSKQQSSSSYPTKRPPSLLRLHILDSASDTRGLATPPSSTPPPTLGSWRPRLRRLRLRRLRLRRLRLRHSGAGGPSFVDLAFIGSVSDTRGLVLHLHHFRRVDYFRRVDSGPPRRLRSAASTTSAASTLVRRVDYFRRVDFGPPRQQTCFVRARCSPGCCATQATSYSPWPHPMLSRVLRRTGHKQIRLGRHPTHSGACAIQV